MSNTAILELPTFDGEKPFEIPVGTSTIFVGANGTGKTRLAVLIEEKLGLRATRIAAHRAQTLDTSVAKVKQELAQRGLQIGSANENLDEQHRLSQRWGSDAANHLLNDFGPLMQSLYADHAMISHEALTATQESREDKPPKSKLQILIEIWNSIFEPRVLKFDGDDLSVRTTSSGEPYNAKTLSDGERAGFYLIGHALCAPKDGILIFDEPELHLHPAILTKIWDRIEQARSDCGFVIISHDLEFVESRVGKKYVMSDYNHDEKLWNFEEVEEDDFFEERIITRILGSRRPILFVEGEKSSLDYSVFRSCYPDWTIIPRGSSGNVIHSVNTMRKNSQLHRRQCAGIVDADDRTGHDKSVLEKMGVKILKVSEIENIFLLPNVFKALTRHVGWFGVKSTAKLDELKGWIFNYVDNQSRIESVVLRYCRRRVDRAIKKFDLEDSSSVEAVVLTLKKEIAQLDVDVIADVRRKSIQKAIKEQNLEELLLLFDDKALLDFAYRALRDRLDCDLKSWLHREIANPEQPRISKAIKKELPSL